MASAPVATPVTRHAGATMKNDPAARLNRTVENPVAKIPTHCIKVTAITTGNASNLKNSLIKFMPHTNPLYQIE